jgi:hypothetical protein
VADETPMAERLREAADRMTTQVSCYTRGISAQSMLHPSPGAQAAAAALVEHSVYCPPRRGGGRGGWFIAK